MANNQNFSNILLENIDNEIPVTLELITPSKEPAQTTARPTRSKSPINDSTVYLSESFKNHLQQQVLLLQTELKNIDKYIKSFLLQLSKQSDILYYFQNQNLKEL